MAGHRGRVIKPETLYIDRVTFEMGANGWEIGAEGSMELPVGAAVAPGETYRVELENGEATQVRVTGFNEISTKAHFVVVTKAN